MAAATILNSYDMTLAQDPVILEVTDGETYVSKLSAVEFAIATANVDDDGEINCVCSGRTVTINASGMTDKKIALVCYGRL